MKLKSSNCLILLLATVAAAAMPLQAAETPTPKEPASTGTATAEQILARHVKACGGQAALDKTTTLTAKGAFEGLEGTGLVAPAKFEMLLKMPDKYVMSISDTKGLFFRQGVHGAAGWRGGRDTVNDMAPEHVAFAKGLLRVCLPYKFTEVFQKPALQPNEVIGEQRMDVVETTTAEGHAFKFFFDSKSGLLRRVTTELGGIPLRYDWDDYRDVDGIKVAHKIWAQEGEQSYTARFTEVRRNVAVEDAKFQKPAE